MNLVIKNFRSITNNSIHPPVVLFIYLYSQRLGLEILLIFEPCKCITRVPFYIL